MVVGPWPAIAVGFALTDLFVIHIPFRRNTYSMSFTDVPDTASSSLDRQRHGLAWLSVLIAEIC